MNQIYDVKQETDVYVRDSYNYLLNRQKLQNQIQSMKNEELAFLGFRRLFVLAEQCYKERNKPTKLLRQNPDNA